MPLPEVLQVAVIDAINYIKQQPQHEYHPQKRQELIKILMDIPSVGVETRARLAILSGKKVLPTFEAYVQSNPEDFDNFLNPDDYKVMGQETLRIAESVVDGTVTNVEALNSLYDKFYYMIGNISRVMPYHVTKAIDTCYCALNDVVYTCFPVDGKGIDPYLKNTELYKDGVRTSGMNLTNEVWATFGIHSTDSSTQALISFAYDSITKQIQPSKVFEFWQWWLTDALENAWELSNTSR